MATTLCHGIKLSLWLSYKTTLKRSAA